jgi:DNA-binding CsgD family transcriptional regulator
MTDRVWLVVEGDEVPDEWRARSRSVTVIPLLPGESRNLLESGSTAPALEPFDEELLLLLGEGLGTRRIADRLGRPERSVQRRLARLRRDLGAETNTDLALMAARLGLRQPDGGVGGAPSDDAGNRPETTNSNHTTRRRTS